ncbi:hypothetical protein ILUMI_13808 [Ignelater luminosus]|uniref:Peptidase S1 domain-containing protein n=1 Tax=Ignelater luminosus TaxID=2038154 RepID=A0A8K0CRN1_IGNLU|nr:hypothetical protein ILUMI_13808 [Ignelater luminosus]
MYLPNNIIILGNFLLFIFFNGCVCCKKQGNQTLKMIEREDASFKSFSFIAPIVLKSSDRYCGYIPEESLICGSSIITKYWALSSRRCYDYITENEIAATDLLLKSGTNHWNATKKTELNLKVHDVESFYTENYVGVLMLIKVVQSFIRDGITQVPVAGNSYNYNTVKNLVLAGYGSVVSSHLQYFQGTRLPESRCKYRFLDEYTLCLGPSNYQNIIRNVCEGDKGGPIVNPSDGKVLVGVINQQACLFGLRYVEHIKIGPLEAKLREFAEMVGDMAGIRFV